MGLRCCQARWRMRTCFCCDPAVSPKRQLSHSCSTAHIYHLELVKIDNRVGGCVPLIATHFTFHEADTSVRMRLLSDFTRQASVRPPNGKDKAATDQSVARSSSPPTPPELQSLPSLFRASAMRSQPTRRPAQRAIPMALSLASLYP